MFCSLNLLKVKGFVEKKRNSKKKEERINQQYIHFVVVYM